MNTQPQQIEQIKISDIVPYFRNARKNDAAVKYVRRSIEQFGFKIPIVIDKDNVVICGHTRLKAAKKIGMETVPCIRATDLTEDQVKAFRLADNKVGEIAQWDEDLLKIEVADIKLDLVDFGFDDSITQFQLGEADIMDDITESTEEEGDEEAEVVEEYQESTTIVNENVIFKTQNPMGIPELREDMLSDVLPTSTFVRRAGNWSECLMYVWGTDAASVFKDYDVKDGAMCFYTADYRFMQMWTNAAEMIERLKSFRFKNAVGLDFTVCDDSPVAIKLNMKYRSMWCNRMMQEGGIKVIPSITAFSKPGSFMYDYDLVGIPKGAPVVSVQMQTLIRDDNTEYVMKLIRGGFIRILDEIKPKHILLYGNENVIRNKFLGYLPNFDGYRIVQNMSQVKNAMLAEQAKQKKSGK